MSAWSTVLCILAGALLNDIHIQVLSDCLFSLFSLCPVNAIEPEIVNIALAICLIQIARNK